MNRPGAKNGFYTFEELKTKIKDYVTETYVAS